MNFALDFIRGCADSECAIGDVTLSMRLLEVGRDEGKSVSIGKFDQISNFNLSILLVILGKSWLRFS